MNNLIVILGPTAVGKTELSLRLAEYFQSPIINADSRQIFAEMHVGTAAPTKDQLSRVKHYFVATHHVGDYFSASMFEQQVVGLLSQPFPHPVILSGGSMMYIDAVCNGIDDIPTIRPDIRAMMKQRLTQEGLPALVEELRLLDPIHYQIVDHHNPRRVLHALEICHQTGKTYTSFRKHDLKEDNLNTSQQRPFHIIKIGITRTREELYSRINLRVDRMMTEGLLDEARKLYPFRHENALNTVGYKELFAYFDGFITLDEAVRQIQSNTRRYCRKQLTWFKRDKSIAWFHPDEFLKIIHHIQDSMSLVTGEAGA